MISLNEFKCATFEQKCDVVTTKSDYLMMRTQDHHKVYLYHTGAYFIEVYYSSLYKRVLMINAFNDFVGLDSYTDGISLSDLNLTQSELWRWN
jgi:hypothetical protein